MKQTKQIEPKNRVQTNKRIHVIINPAAGQDTPVLATLNAVFRPAGVDWSVSITQKAGDAKAQAAAAIAEGVDLVATYGGDGTFVEAASAMIHSEIPLAMLPGGTANAMAYELGIPLDLTAACHLVCSFDTEIRRIDIGQVNDTYFLLRVGIGAEGKITEKANREMKKRLGLFAYMWSAVQNLIEIEQATYYVTIDGEEKVLPGITCGIVNSGKMGLGELNILPTVHIDDGKLDVILVQNTDLPALTTLIGGMLGIDEHARQSGQEQASLTARASRSVQIWQCQEITVRVDPPQTIQYDGELLDASEVHCRILPQALRVLVPAT